MDTEVRLKVKTIFEHLRKQQPRMKPRENDHVNVDQMLKDYREHDSQDN